MIRRPGILLLSVAVGPLLALGVTVTAQQAAGEVGFAEEVLPFLAEHCESCHSGKRPSAGFDIGRLSADFVDGPSIGRWLEVVEKLNSGLMPPPSQRDRPTEEQSSAIAAWVSERIAAGEATRLAATGSTSFHRLTRQEYANTIRDLLGVQFEASESGALLEDEDWRGLERIGSVLSLSAAHIERYFAAAEQILSDAYPDIPATRSTDRRTALDVLGGRLGPGEQGLEPNDSLVVVPSVRLDVWPGQVVRVEPAGGGLEFAGRYRIRAQMSGLRPEGGRAPHIEFGVTGSDRLLHEQDLLAPEGGPTVVEFEANLPAGPLQFTVANAVPGPTILTRLGRSLSAKFSSLEKGRIPWQIPLIDENNLPLYPLLIWDWIEWEGPLPPVDTTRAIYMPDTQIQIRSKLEAFATKAFRRPLIAGEVDQYVDLAFAEIATGADPRSAMKASMQAILCSHGFLYLVEGSRERTVNELDDWELASRLSYFLWSTMPDQRLARLAAKGQLRRPEVLEAEVVRMLDDPRIERFANSFSRQWLQLGRVGQFTPDSELYPEYDKYLERSMVGETTAFFAEVLADNLSLREFLRSDWTMLNSRLALHYGIPGVTNDGFQRVTLGPNDHRSGLLTQASILSLTSDGSRHRPVHRGAWVSEAILGKIPPPPPANVEPIAASPSDKPKPTIRQRLEAHRSNPSCAVCHRQIDPLGFAFDNYDAIGRWRTEEIVEGGIGPNPQVDSSGKMPDGQTFNGPLEFQKLLVQDIDTFNAAFVAKLASYGLRRTASVNDRGALADIATASKEHDYRLRDLVQALVLSDLFRQR